MTALIYSSTTPNVLSDEAAVAFFPPSASGSDRNARGGSDNWPRGTRYQWGEIVSFNHPSSGLPIARVRCTGQKRASIRAIPTIELSSSPINFNGPTPCARPGRQTAPECEKFHQMASARAMKALAKITGFRLANARSHRPVSAVKDVNAHKFAEPSSFC